MIAIVLGLCLLTFAIINAFRARIKRMVSACDTHTHTHIYIYIYIYMYIYIYIRNLSGRGSRIWSPPTTSPSSPSRTAGERLYYYCYCFIIIIVFIIVVVFIVVIVIIVVIIILCQMKRQLSMCANII
jgi:hypothetical protein